MGNDGNRWSSPLKIGLVTPFFLPKIGGANIYCYELARALSQMGHEVHLFSVPGALEDQAYQLHPVLTKNISQDIETLRRHQMDAWHSLFMYYAPMALHLPNVVVTVHGDDGFSFQLRYRLPGWAWLERRLLWRLPSQARATFRRWLEQIEVRYNRRLYRRALSRAKRVITVSSFTRDRLSQAYPAARDKAIVIPPGVAEAFFSRGAGKHNPKRLLTVTRLDEHDRIKNVHNVIAALGILKDRYDFHYTVISGTISGGYKDELLGMIDSLGLTGRVSIEGRKTEAELLQHYRDAGLFILASYAEPNNFEGFGIVFLEANAQGTPVLTTREGGMTDYIHDGVNGLYVRDPSANGIREALEHYWSGQVRFDPAVIEAAPQPYRWGNIAQRIADIYEQAIA